MGSGTILATFRVRWTGEHKRWWVHRKKTYGINLQAVTDERGNLLWISDGLPGSTHDLSAARHHGIIAAAQRLDVRLWTDRGFATLKCWQILTRIRCTVGKTAPSPRPSSPYTTPHRRLGHAFGTGSRS